jgi:RND family efflux transporter MFP subunit
MRSSVLFLLFVAVIGTGRAGDPPKVDLKKGVEFTGRAEAKLVEIRPHVTGYLDRLLVKEGEAVRKGDVLAELDDRPYKLKLDAARTQLDVARAEAKLAAANLERAKDAAAKGTGTKEDVTAAEAARDLADARTESVKSLIAVGELELTLTKLISPIDGRVNRVVATAGNLHPADGAPVACVVAADPIAVLFDVDERTVLAVRKAVRDNGDKPVVEVGLSDEDGFPHKAALETTAVTIDPAAGTARLRAALPNPKDLIVPGQFVRVKLTVQSSK